MMTTDESLNGVITYCTVPRRLSNRELMMITMLPDVLDTKYLDTALEEIKEDWSQDSVRGIWYDRAVRELQDLKTVIRVLSEKQDGH
jgi:hypothetical protein